MLKFLIKFIAYGNHDTKIIMQLLFAMAKTSERHQGHRDSTEKSLLYTAR